MDPADIAAACVMLTLIGLLFGALALLIGAATGRVRTAILVPAVAAVSLHVANALGELSGAGWCWRSPPSPGATCGDPESRRHPF